MTTTTAATTTTTPQATKLPIMVGVHLAVLAAFSLMFLARFWLICLIPHKTQTTQTKRQQIKVINGLIMRQQIQFAASRKVLRQIEFCYCCLEAKREYETFSQ